MNSDDTDEHSKLYLDSRAILVHVHYYMNIGIQNDRIPSYTMIVRVSEKSSVSVCAGV